MFVADLHCENGHEFEGWFASSDELASQRARGLLACPVCGSHQVERRLSAPRLNVSALKAERLGQGRPVVSQPGVRDAAEGARAMGRPQQMPQAGEPSKTTPDVQPPVSEEAAQALAQVQSMYWQAVRHVMAHTEDVGERFVEEVRGMHQGDVPTRPVRGQASSEEREALREEGIEVMSLPIPADLKDTLQ